MIITLNKLSKIIIMLSTHKVFKLNDRNIYENCENNWAAKFKKIDKS